jgi:hypothetical protein
MANAGVKISEASRKTAFNVDTCCSRVAKDHCSDLLLAGGNYFGPPRLATNWIELSPTLASGDSVIANAVFDTTGPCEAP